MVLARCQGHTDPSDSNRAPRRGISSPLSPSLLFWSNLVLIVLTFVVRKFNFYSSSVMCQHIKNSCNIYSPSVDNLVNLNYSLG